MDGTADAIAQAYREHAKGATLIFAVSVEQCYEIAKRIEGAEVVTGQTKDRADIIRRFTQREISCLVNCMVFTEGTDIPPCGNCYHSKTHTVRCIVYANGRQRVEAAP